MHAVAKAKSGGEIRRKTCTALDLALLKLKLELVQSHMTCFPKPTAQDVSKIYVLRFPDEPDKISCHRWQHLNVV
jgi:hypothetical protein